jgi:uncharacterized membrane protein
MPGAGGKWRRRWMQAAFWAAYPLIVFFGVRFFEPRYIALLLAGVALARNFRSVGRFAAGQSLMNKLVFIALLLVSGMTALTNNELFLRLYPIAVNIGMLTLFAASLFSPQSLVEQFARRVEPDISSEGVLYTRRVTQVWCVFFVVNGTIAALTAFFSSREFWGLYNGLIAYLLMAALFAGEWCCRRHFFGKTGVEE